MNPRIRIIGVVLLLCFVALFIQLNNIQIREAPALDSNKLAATGEPHLLYEARGAILSSNRQILAYSRKVKDPWDGGHEIWQRVYPNATAEAFGQITGFLDTAEYGVSYGIEAEYNHDLEQHESSPSTLSGILTQHQETDDVVLTVPTTLQEDAERIIGGHDAAEVVALDPRNGDILAMDGTPNYNPNLLSTLNPKSFTKSYDSLAGQYPEPFDSIASAVPHGPGSTFKVISTAAIFDHDPSLASTVWPVKTEIHLPDTPSPFHNYGYEACGGPLAEILTVSCDTAYAEVGLALGARTVVSEAESFGWCQESAKRISGQCAAGGSPPPIDLPSDEVSGATLAPESLLAANPPYLAYSSIGQLDDAASALSMALVAAGIANNGKIMAPHLMKEIVDSDGNVVARYHPHVWKVATSSATATRVRQLMLGPTGTGGTAAGVFSNLQSEGIQVAAKTGTAEHGNTTVVNCATNDWLIAMAPAGAGQTPKAVVALEVFTPNGMSACSDATGATVAGPLIDQMLTDVLKAGQ